MTELFDDAAFRVFCLSMQRTGTTSVGKFFRDFGFEWAGAPADAENRWYLSWYEGDFEAIFSSHDFRSANGFEDSPWFLPDFYKVLFNRFVNSKFILFIRNEDDWFESMLRLGGGDIIGIQKLHSKLYRRELEFFELWDAGVLTPEEPETDQFFREKVMKMVGHRDHYKRIYRLHNIEVQDYFTRHSPGALFVADLNDPQKWVKLGSFLGIEVPEDYDSYENATRAH